MGFLVRMMNVGRGERIFRFIIRSCFDCLGVSYFRVHWVDSWTHRGGNYSYRHIWILTLKRIHAEGLQQRRGKEVKRTMRRTIALLAILPMSLVIFPLPSSPHGGQN